MRILFFLAVCFPAIAFAETYVYQCEDGSRIINDFNYPESLTVQGREDEPITCGYLGASNETLSKYADAVTSNPRAVRLFSSKNKKRGRHEPFGLVMS